MDNSPFAKLSAELRNKIYDLVIGPRRYNKPTNIGKACQVEVARVCRQMRAESLPMCFSNIKARVNVVSNFDLPSDHKDETATLDHHWGPCRAKFFKGASNIMAIAKRISIHPQACYDGLAQLNLRIILDVEDHGFALAWLVWEPHFQALAEAIAQRGLDERLRVRIEYHTFKREDKMSVPGECKAEFEQLGLRLDEVRCIVDRDLVSEMANLRKEWREYKSWDAGRDKSRPSPPLWFDYLWRNRRTLADIEMSAQELRKEAAARGEDIGELDDGEIEHRGELEEECLEHRFSSLTLG